MGYDGIHVLVTYLVKRRQKRSYENVSLSYDSGLFGDQDWKEYTKIQSQARRNIAKKQN